MPSRPGSRGLWSRELHLRRDGGEWHVSTHETGSLDDALAASGHPQAPLPGMDDPDRLTGVLDVHAATVPMTLTPMLHRTGLALGHPIEVNAAYILVPSLAVIPRVETLTMVDQHTINLGMDGYCAALEIDADRMVTHYPGLVRRLD
ncbi:putative glycolipid-binding domain-containing protein [Micromonospora thermarum]|uniref:Glycolipid-binding domain-containing protein n=1 Tax=Micromonospora thermarum TaxID=2720024 RepID=A0ABX0Z524_9ACTN|nr:putative glycolipid-binding domain-containing protein [Micromonospora thermarum]NJP32578.1 putative glycolipid-binding domain-containing protein [Micromonospora thermarum]